MRYLFFLLLLVASGAQAQLKSYIIGAKGDTLNRVDAKGLKQGPWYVKVDNLRGERGYEEEGFFKNDQKEGVWRRYSLEGDLIAMENYRFGYKHGKCAYFNYQGELVREEAWRAIDPQSPYDTVAVYDVNDAQKILRYEVIKVEPNSYKHGTWRYFDPMSGKLEETQEWVMNKIKEDAPPATAAAEGDEDLKPIDVSKGGSAKKDQKKEVAKPQAVLDFEKKNSGKKKVKYRTGETGG
jgi:hypothetical protein